MAGPGMELIGEEEKKELLEVIVPGYTFIASISSIIYARAIPILAEVDKTLDLDPEDV